MSALTSPGSPAALPGDGAGVAVVLHEPFFVALANLEGKEDNAEWHAAVAGLVVLRLLDSRLVRSMDSPDDAFDVRARAAQQASAAVDPDNPCATALGEFCRAVAGQKLPTVARALLAYGRALSDDNRWLLAADAYATLLRVADTPPFASSAAAQSIVPFAYNRLARSLRIAGQLDTAAQAYAAGRRAARARGDREAELRLRIGEAQILVHLGNLPAAAAALDAVVVEAAAAQRNSPQRQRHPSSRLFDEAVEREDIVALARHDRGAIAANQGDLPTAVQHYYAAWRSYHDPIRRERVWADMAHALSVLDLRAGARDAYLVLSAKARQRELRLIASVNLVELAALDGHQREYDDHRRRLHEACDRSLISPKLAAQFALVEGQCEARFGRPDAAATALERALDIATRHRVNEVIIRADEALASVRAGQPPPARDTPAGVESISPELERITRAVRRVRRRSEPAGSRRA